MEVTGVPVKWVIITVIIIILMAWYINKQWYDLDKCKRRLKKYNQSVSEPEKETNSKSERLQPTFID